MENSQESFSVRKILKAFDALGPLEQAALLTLPLLLLYADDHWYIKIPVVIVSLAGLLFGALRRQAYFWFVLICFMAAGIFYNWQSADNHKYLITYWCMALFFVHFFDAGEQSLKDTARYLIGLAFGFAVLWKLFTPDFMNGNFFEYTFLFDERFSGKLEAFGILHSQSREFNLLAEEALTVYDSQLIEADLLTNYSLKLLAEAMVWWTLGLEGLIAICFLLPARFRITRVGDGGLILFLLSTYLVAPVVGFGWVIGAMGFVQCDNSRWKTRMVYLVVILFLQAYRMPWTSIADAALH